MTLKILVSFADKYNGTIYSAGDVIEFETKRAEELLKDERKLVEKAKANKKATAK